MSVPADTGQVIDCRIPAADAGQRLDQALARLLPAYSRARLQQWLRDGVLRVNGEPRRPRDRVLGGERVTGRLTPARTMSDRPQPLPLRIVFEDDDLIVVDKPAGMVVHPAAGNPDGTLVNALLHHEPRLDALPRAGLVHRLDKDTSGLLVVARSLRAHASLVAQLQARTMGRDYLALVEGWPSAGGSIDTPLGRHPVDRKRMAVLSAGGKRAVTHYRIARRYRFHTLLDVRLETGRTHQIRVHMQHLRYPLVGDPVYGRGARRPSAADRTPLDERARTLLAAFRRQALHAARLRLTHPAEGGERDWQSAPPDDMAALLAGLEQDRRRQQVNE